MPRLCFSYRVIEAMFWKLDIDEIMPRLYMHFERKCCEAISRLALVEIEVLYFDGSHA